MTSKVEGRKSKVIALVAALAAVGAAAPQQTSTEAELEKLRRFLGLPAQAKLSVAPAATLPEGARLKVYLATGLDVRVRENLARWAEEWNRKDAAKARRTLVLVQDLAEAQVVLAREVDTDKARTVRQTFSTPGMAPPRSSGTTRPQHSTFEVLQAPVRSYVLAVASPGEVQVVWRDVGLGIVEASDSTGRPLWDDFRKLLRRQKP
jgi:hypothetical protein